MPRNDRRMFLVFIVVMSAVALVFYYFGRKNSKKEDISTQQLNDSVAYAEKLFKERDKKGYDYVYDDNTGAVRVLFDFDPNTADSIQMKQLGLSKWQIKNIYKYRNKGGVFRHKEDFSRIYGITEKQYRELSPHIVISSDYQQAKPRYVDVYTQEPLKRDTLIFPYKLKQGQTIFLNTSDTTELKKVPGIGSSFAKTIVRYKDRLGGFYDKSQLLEIEGLPENVLDYFRNDHFPLKKININKASINEMRRHPYINFYQARAISDYRRLKGSLKDITELRLLPEFNENDIERLKRYLAY